MGPANNIGKYHLGRTIGEGNFAKVKLAMDTTTGRNVAIKIIDKQRIMDSDLRHQVKREIRTMKLLHHPNIVRIYEVIGTKTKVYIVMEYVAGGQLSDKLSYTGRFEENEARKMFHQLIDAVDYCHHRGVYHRDLKPENLLLDSKGNIKVSDFGLSALRKPGDILSTACGSPSYVGPELLTGKGYEGAPADIWSCGVILFELLAGHLPFDDRNLINLYKKIAKAEYKCPSWFTASQRNIISRTLDPDPKTRIKICEIVEDAWFKIDYTQAIGSECDWKYLLDDVSTAFDATEEDDASRMMPRSSNFINAFQLIAMSNDLDLSGLFEEQDENKQKTTLGSKNTVGDTFKKIEAAATSNSLAVERLNNKMKLHQRQKWTRCTKSDIKLAAEVIEVTPSHCVIQISKSAGELGVYKQFCKSLSALLEEKSSVPSQGQRSEELKIESRNIPERGSSEEDANDSPRSRGYSST